MATSLSPREAGITIQVDCGFSTIGHFEIARLETENSRGKGHRNELRFVVKFGGIDTASQGRRMAHESGRIEG